MTGSWPDRDAEPGGPRLGLNEPRRQPLHPLQRHRRAVHLLDRVRRGHSLQAGLGHVAQFGGSHQHGAAALGDPVDRDALGLGGAQHGLEHLWPFDAGDLDAERGAVGEGRWLPAGDAQPVQHVRDPAHRCSPVRPVGIGG
jgi:hypothetical protein